MSYFTRFPLLAYSSNTLSTTNIVSDVLKRVVVDQKTRENLVIFDEYDVQDGETPELISFKFYETTEYHWVVLLVNDILDPRYGWPLTDEQLYTYTANKYGSANVNTVHHYTISETSDIIVDPTQEQSLTIGNFYNNFPDNVDYLFDYAANGTIDLTLSEGKRSFIDYLQRISDDPLPNMNVALSFRIGDVDHSYRTDANSKTITTLDASAFAELALGNEINPNPTGETYNYNFIRTYIKPYVDNWYENPLSENSSPPLNFGNVEGLNSLGIIIDSGPYNPFKHYKGSTGNLYAISSTLSANVLNYAQGNLSLNPARLNNYIGRTAGGYSTWGLNPSQGEALYYLRGDITRSTFFSGRLSQGGNPSTELDGNVALTFQRGLLPKTSPYYDTTLELLIAMNANATIKTALSDSQIIVQTDITVNPYANAYPVTNIAYESDINESKRRIRVLKPQYLNAFVNEFERLVNG
jgi:hypothetical protein